MQVAFSAWNILSPPHHLARCEYHLIIAHQSDSPGNAVTGTLPQRPCGPMEALSAMKQPQWAHHSPDVPQNPQRELLLYLIITVPINNSSNDTSLQNQHMHI